MPSKSSDGGSKSSSSSSSYSSSSSSSYSAPSKSGAYASKPSGGISKQGEAPRGSDGPMLHFGAQRSFGMTGGSSRFGRAVAVIAAVLGVGAALVALLLLL